MKKLQGIVSEIPAVKKKSVPVETIPAFSQSKVFDGPRPVFYVPKTTDRGGFTMLEERKPRWKRLLVNTALVIFLSAFAIFGLIQAAGGGQSSFDDNIDYIQIHVERGDTLWGLIRQHNPEYEGDIRILIQKASDRNDGSGLISGSVVEIPVVQELE